MRTIPILPLSDEDRARWPKLAELADHGNQSGETRRRGKDEQDGPE